MFGTSGIRGPVGETVTAGLALRVGRALGGWTRENGTGDPRVVVGRDPRESGQVLVDALAAGLRECGVSVVDLGMAATPTVARAVAPEDAAAGAVVTASHNPAPDNGIKLWQPSGQAFDESRRAEIVERLEADDPDLEPWDGLGDRRRADATVWHADALVERTPAVDRSVVVDLGNGAGGVTVDALDRLGCAVETMNAQPDGTFPGRPSEPTAEHCGSLTTLVRESDADLGIAHDGDADRMRAVAGDGEFLPGDTLLAILAADAADPGDRVAVPVDTSLAVADFLAERDVETVRTPVGDVYVAAEAAEPGVAFGGEPSGAWIWPDETLCPDGSLAACRLVALDAERPLAERAAAVPTYPIRRESIETDRKAAVMDRVREAVGSRYDAAAVDRLDGVRVDEGDGWFLLRASGTQPLIRVTAEARDPDRADELRATAAGLVTDAMEEER